MTWYRKIVPSQTIMKSTIKILIILLIIKFQFSYSQSDVESAMNYHKMVNNAEELASDGYFKLALDSYSKALDCRYTFAQDIFNASLCAMKLDNYEEAEKLCEQLVLRGCTMNFFLTKKFEPLRNNRVWQKFSNNYSKLNEEFSKKNKNAIVTELHRLIDIDQNNFCLLPSNLENKPFLDSLKNNSSYVSKRLIELFKFSDFLDENTIGANIKNDTLIVPLPLFSVLIRHHYQNKKYDLTTYSKEQFYFGKIKPEVFANWYDLELIGLIGSEHVILNDCNLYFNKFLGIKETILQNRKKYYLPSLESIEKKIIYKKCNSKCEFIFFMPISIIDSIDSNMKEMLNENYTKHISKVSNCK